MKYGKLIAGILALLLLAALSWILVSAARQILMDGAGMLAALGDFPAEESEPIPQITAAPIYIGPSSEGRLDPDIQLVPGETDSGHVVFDTQNLDLFDVPVDMEASFLSPLPTSSPDA